MRASFAAWLVSAGIALAIITLLYVYAAPPALGGTSSFSKGMQIKFTGLTVDA